jgi:hypothetical protein
MESYWYEPSSGEVWDASEHWLVQALIEQPDAFVRRDFEFNEDGAAEEIRDANGKPLLDGDLTPAELRWLQDAGERWLQDRIADARDWADEARASARWEC